MSSITRSRPVLANLLINQRIESMRMVASTGYGQPSDRERAQGRGLDQHLEFCLYRITV